MFRIKRIDHVAICVPDLDEALARYRDVLGLEVAVRETVASEKTEAALLPIADSSLELITPKGNESLAKFLEKRGPGLHHVALEIEGLDDAIAVLKALGVPLVDEVPRLSATGQRGVFIHPKALGGVLVELLETTH